MDAVAIESSNSVGSRLATVVSPLTPLSTASGSVDFYTDYAERQVGALSGGCKSAAPLCLEGIRVGRDASH